MNTKKVDSFCSFQLNVILRKTTEERLDLFKAQISLAAVDINFPQNWTWENLNHECKNLLRMLCVIFFYDRSNHSGIWICYHLSEKLGNYITGTWSVLVSYGFLKWDWPTRTPTINFAKNQQYRWPGSFRSLHSGTETEIGWIIPQLFRMLRYVTILVGIVWEKLNF